MRTVAQDYKPLSLIGPQVSSGSTISGSGVAITPSEEGDGVAIVHVGAIVGSPTSWSVVVTIAASATSGGTYVTLATIGSPSLASTNAGPEIATAALDVNTGAYAYVKATAVVTFTGGTTPSLAIGVSLLQRQTVGSTSNVGALV